MTWSSSKLLYTCAFGKIFRVKLCKVASVLLEPYISIALTVVPVLRYHLRYLIQESGAASEAYLNGKEYITPYAQHRDRSCQSQVRGTEGLVTNERSPMCYYVVLYSTSKIKRNTKYSRRNYGIFTPLVTAHDLRYLVYWKQPLEIRMHHDHIAHQCQQ